MTVWRPRVSEEDLLPFWFVRQLIKALLPWNTQWQHQIGAIYATGEDGIPKNERLAVKWYRRAAVKGDAESQYDLGFMYLLGEGTAADPNEACRWLKLAAEKGEHRAARLLADLYGDGGYGVPPDPAKAAYWSEKAITLQANTLTSF